ATSCNTKIKKEPYAQIKPPEKIEVLNSKNLSETQNFLNNNWLNEIVLDNGEKWQANHETTKGIHGMLKTLKETEEVTKVDFQKLGNHLNSSKNKIIKSCNMKGDAHDNLHVFMVPLIEKLNELSSVSTLEDGQILKENIQ